MLYYPGMDIHKKLDEALAAVREEAFAAGKKAGYQEAAKDADNQIHKAKFQHIAQGRENALDEARKLLDETREEGRVMGVEEGRTSAESIDQTRAKKQGYNEGHLKGHRAGYKEGRGEGYKNGWNDAVSTPVRDQRAR